jgi:hypothetical protein
LVIDEKRKTILNPQFGENGVLQKVTESKGLPHFFLMFPFWRFYLNKNCSFLDNPLFFPHKILTSSGAKEQKIRNLI